uniref:SFRICE_021063 n=1 Tax=Spodoptera frugiperda TaxID=7108 RepID=A0A2H1W7D0_SPOFR
MGQERLSGLAILSIEHSMARKLYSVKKQSDTRWEAKINSVKSVRFQICEIHDTLDTLANVTEKTDHTTSHEATILAEQLKDFKLMLLANHCNPNTWVSNTEKLDSRKLHCNKVTSGERETLVTMCCIVSASGNFSLVTIMVILEFFLKIT